MKRHLMSLFAAAAVALGFSFGAHPAFAQQEIKIGIVASLSGPFVAAAKDTLDGLHAWQKTHGVPGKKLVFETLDDETNPVSAANAFRRLTSPSFPISGFPDLCLRPLPCRILVHCQHILLRRFRADGR